MSKSLKELKHFIKKNYSNFSDYELKLAKIILDNFYEIEKSSSAGGKRGKLISRLINESCELDNVDLLIDMKDETTIATQVNRLSKLTVKNFRGFTEEHTFDFKKPYIFIYGPNGSGKSSFCEALEYSLLGTINEANAKRIGLNTYIKNAYTGKSELPILKGFNSKDIEIDVKTMPKDYEFCFIERNRIEGFARVSANTPQTQQQRLSALFGLEEFNNFVSNFNETLEKYLDCEGKLTKRLLEEEKKIELHKQTLESVFLNRLEIKKQEEDLLEKHENINSLVELKERISGSDDQEGLIQKNNNRIALIGSLKPKADPGIDVLIREIKHVDSLIQERDEGIDSLKIYKDEISLKDLYKSILQNEDKFSNVCPACESELYKDGELSVPINPFHNAINKVQEFEIAIKLETKVEELNEKIPKVLTGIRSIILQIVTLGEDIEFSKLDILCAINQQLKSEEDERIKDSVGTVIHYFYVLEELKDELIIFNKKVNEVEKEVKILKEENKKHEQVLESITRIKAKRESLDESERNSGEAIRKFTQENQELIKEVEKEKLAVQNNSKYRDAYTLLKTRLEEYNRQLPSELASDLNANTMAFYNSINRYDHPGDLVKGIKLPATSGEKIEINFENGKNLDALHILSEGHIRCLGLAILLAKNVQDKLPLVIFDDVVNAIDDEHRRGIIETILENEAIKNKQLIITTHGEEFIKQLENNIPNKFYKQKVERIDFQKTDVARKITVKLNLPRNYLILAERRLDEGQIRDSLAHSRRALEKLINKLWNKLSKKYNIHLKVSMRSPGKPPELMSTTQALRKFIEKNTISEYEIVVSSLTVLLGMEHKNPIEWNYLNKGTHEEDRKEEFDRIVVEEMIGLLKQIDDSI
ncbi:AAA family ATPase [[Bacillus] enclensis]|uniref:AAA family ATPase n=1 Tax=[Bacillus] enclensis TaxID=1402860 RepID=UPI0018DB7E6F|nr:AAA family ATPase [[Bacillus] enclensis]MBH9968888.1 AAA family ATPase [[Bacillus] enclensis]